VKARLLLAIESTLAAVGGVLFLLGIFTRSRTLWVVGLNTMAVGVLAGVLIFTLTANGRNRWLTGASVGLGILLTVWLVVWTVNRPPAWAVGVSILLVCCAFALAFAWWQRERQGNSS
jgi:hypothetical protein